MTPKGVAITVVITMIIVLIALARDSCENKTNEKSFIISLTVLFIFCTKESKEQLLLERIDGIVWTRGTNFMTLQSNPLN